MLKKSGLMLACAFAVIVAYTAISGEIENASKATCPVSGKAISTDVSADYKGGTLYFCCPGCPDGFEAKKEDLAWKANYQLFLTGQAEQKACPMTGRPMNAEKVVKVSDVNVTVCCPNCEGKLNKAKGDTQTKLAFSDKAFEKGFEVAKKKN